MRMQEVAGKDAPLGSPQHPYNNDVHRNGRTYHVQTEDLGGRARMVVTQVFCEGRVLETRKSIYPDANNPVELIEAVVAVMRDQHKAAMKAIVHGVHESELDRTPTSPSLPVPIVRVQEAATPPSVPVMRLDSVRPIALETNDSSPMVPRIEPSVVDSALMANVSVINGQARGQRLRLYATPLILGRDWSCPLCLDDPSVAPKHCLFVLDGIHWRIIELGSSSGVTINGKRVNSALLANGDLICVGKVEMRFAVSDIRTASTDPAVPIVRGQPIEDDDHEIAATRRALSELATDEMALIPASTVHQGSLELIIPAFLLDRTLVTNDDYKKYIDATNAPAPEHWLGRSPPHGKHDHPVVGVTLSEARRYASWRNKRLPTTLEWEAAVRGTEGRRYPWGNQWSADRCICRESGAEGTAPVGSRASGTTIEGCLDLLGNVWEWTEADLRSEQPEVGYAHVMGGAYNTPCESSGKLPRTSVNVQKSYTYLGFRCARDLKGAGR